MGCFLCRLPPERQEIKSILASIEEELDISMACLGLLVLEQYWKNNHSLVVFGSILLFYPVYLLYPRFLQARQALLTLTNNA